MINTSIRLLYILVTLMSVANLYANEIDQESTKLNAQYNTKSLNLEIDPIDIEESEKPRNIMAKKDTALLS